MDLRLSLELKQFRAEVSHLVELVCRNFFVVVKFLKYFVQFRGDGLCHVGSLFIECSLTCGTRKIFVRPSTSLTRRASYGGL